MNISHPYTGLILVITVIITLLLFVFLMIFLEMRNNKLKRMAREFIPDMLKYGWIEGRVLRQRLHERGVRIGGVTFYYLMAELVGDGIAECQKTPRVITKDFFEDQDETETETVSEEIWIRRYRLTRA